MYFKFFLFFFVSLGVHTSIMADPWGKDADLARPPLTSACAASPKPRSFLVDAGMALIRFHQEVISPADGPRSHYFPSSSQYTLEAICRYGFFKGAMMGCDRLMRENDEEWVYRKIIDPQGRYMKWDPVP